MIRINIEVGEDTRETWHAFADDREDYSSLTHLITLAVEHEIQEKRGQRPRGRAGARNTTTPDANTDALDDRMEAMQDSISELSDTVRDLELSNQADGLKAHKLRQAKIKFPIVETNPAYQPSNNYTHNTSHRKKQPDWPARSPHRNSPHSRELHPTYQQNRK